MSLAPRSFVRRGQFENGAIKLVTLLFTRDLVCVVEVGEQAVKFALRNRIVLMIVAARAPERQAEKCSTRRGNTVRDSLNTVLLEIDAAFVVAWSISMESRRHKLICRRMGQHIAGKLV